jgi:undecaprenyl pyrophosphate phosphatase UppP
MGGIPDHPYAKSNSIFQKQATLPGYYRSATTIVALATIYQQIRRD